MGESAMLGWAFRSASLTSVFCAGLIGLWAVVTAARSGYVEVGGNGFELLVIGPALLALVAWLVAILLVPVLLITRGLTRKGDGLTAAGQVITAVLILLAVLSQYRPNATGWELVLIGPALVAGQLVVLIGLLRCALN
ncbi:hypothetical protein HH308_14105 [Gordonia sp. TBRC 11910]|uniref:Uncharacterized protein n=1 Tax=Gordonia asplenii TaxID=2725283 RepID=A0A848L3Y8_9ACTN|nr:hypothetical protein [Gordonia asplenii]NMO02348.1 hypothetical protein [Gordonia asplenii]